MTKAEYIVHCQVGKGMTLDEAKAEADLVYGANCPMDANAGTKPLTDAEKKSIERAKVMGEQADQIADGWIGSMQDLERRAQQAHYPGEIRRITKLANDKAFAKRRFERLQNRM